MRVAGQVWVERKVAADDEHTCWYAGRNQIQYAVYLIGNDMGGADATPRGAALTIPCPLTLNSKPNRDCFSLKDEKREGGGGGGPASASDDLFQGPVNHLRSTSPGPQSVHTAPCPSIRVASVATDVRHSELSYEDCRILWCQTAMLTANQQDHQQGV